MERVSNVTCANTTFNTTPNRQLWCNGHDYTRSLSVPLLHIFIMVLGMCVNGYMITRVYRVCAKGQSFTRRRVGVTDIIYARVGLCDMARLSTIPIWATQALNEHGWIFGGPACKCVKGLITVGVSILV